MQQTKKSNKSTILLSTALILSLASMVFSFLNWQQIQNNKQEIDSNLNAAFYINLDPAFVVNFAANNRHYMQVSVALMGRSQEKLQRLSQHFPALRDKLVMLFAAQDFGAMQTNAGKDALREQATKSVKELAMAQFGDPIIEQVLFTNLVLQ